MKNIDVNYIFERGSALLNEDNILIGKDLFGVFDGASSLTPWRDEKGRTGALRASLIAKEVFEKANKSLIALAREANLRLKKEMERAEIDTSKKINVWSTTCAVVKIKKDFFDWAQIGDSLILVIYENNLHKLLVRDYDHDEEVLTLWKKLADKKVRNIREVVNEEVINIREKMNVTYGMLSGEEHTLSFLNKGRESLKQIKHILLFTDGLLIPKENPADKDDFDTFIRLFLEGGLVRVKDYVRNIEKNDPECWKYPRYKQYDDIAAISLSF